MDNIIQLYEGKPPGSEDWDWEEGKNDRNSMNVMTVYNEAIGTVIGNR